MRISLCTPVVGRFRLFERVLCSLLMQDYENYELVVEDGGVEHPVTEDARIKKLFELLGAERLSYAVVPPRGIFYGLNGCVARARGDVIGVLYSDDLLCPGALGVVDQVFGQDRFSTMGWVYGKTVSVDERGRRLGIDGRVVTYGEMLEHNRIGLNGVFIGRGLLNLAGGFDVRYQFAADYELYLRLWRFCEPTFVDEELGVFRHHEEQASHVSKLQVEAEAAMVAERHRCLADVITSARNTWLAKKAYGGIIPPRRED